VFAWTLYYRDKEVVRVSLCVFNCLVDTQLRVCCQSLDKIGVEINEMISIRDDKTHILETFEKLKHG
jgi:hypothetical protein